MGTVERELSRWLGSEVACVCAFDARVRFLCKTPRWMTRIKALTCSPAQPSQQLRKDWWSLRIISSDWGEKKMRARRSLLAGAVALLTSCAVMAGPQKPTSQTPADPREAIALNAHERAHMMEGMRLYLQALQGIVESLAANKMEGVAQYAQEAGAKMLQGAPMSIPLKAPLAFTAQSLNTHEKFDVLADRSRKSSRGDVLSSLADIMANCTGCHSAYRVVPSP